MIDNCAGDLNTYAYECMKMNHFVYIGHLRTYGVPKKPTGNISNNTHPSNQIGNPQEMTSIILSSRSTLAPATIAIVKTLYEETLWLNLQLRGKHQKHDGMPQHHVVQQRVGTTEQRLLL